MRVRVTQNFGRGLASGDSSVYQRAFYWQNGYGHALGRYNRIGDAVATDAGALTGAMVPPAGIKEGIIAGLVVYGITRVLDMWFFKER